MVARRFQVSLALAHKWFHRAAGKRLDRVDWTDRPRGSPKPPQRTPARIVRAILVARRWLQRSSPLGEYGPEAIRRHLVEKGMQSLPVARTVARIIAAHGLSDRRRGFRPAPPRGWYLADLAEGTAELDEFDWIEGLHLQRGGDIDVLTALSLFGHLASAWVEPAVRTSSVLAALCAHWRQHGAAQFAQFDNATCFQGRPHQPGCLGRVVHFCLCVGVVPVFAPPRETGFQAQIENFNGLWQQRVWRRWRHPSRQALARRSDAFVEAHQQRHLRRIQAAPPRLPMPEALPRQPRHGRVIFLRRSDAEGRVHLLERCFRISPHWPHRLVRCELDVLQGCVSFHALRRAAPTQQPWLASAALTVKLTPWYRASDGAISTQ
jgi:hypothetical protein